MFEQRQSSNAAAPVPDIDQEAQGQQGAPTPQEPPMASSLDPTQVPTSASPSFQEAPSSGSELFQPRSALRPSDIRTMPEHVTQIGPAPTPGRGSSRPVSGKRLLIIVGIVAVVMGGLTAGTYFYFNSSWSPFAAQTPDDATPQVTDNTNAGAAANENANQNQAEPVAGDANAGARDTQRIEDMKIIAQALLSYYNSSNQYPQFLSEIPTSAMPQVPVDPLTKQPYGYSAVNNRQSFVLAFMIEKEAVFKDKVLGPGQHELYPKEFGAPSADDQDTNTNANTDPGQNQRQQMDPQPMNLDADGDGLTAAEEILLQTSPQSLDTDLDGYEDGVEVKNFFSPIHSGSVKLDAAQLVRQYVHQTPSFSFWYPYEWIVDAVDGNASDLVITTGTGEDFTFQVLPNVDRMSSWDWYVRNVSGDFDRGRVSIVTVAGFEAVRTLDGLSVYAAVNDVIYAIRYNLNAVATVNYPNIFSLLLDRLTISP